VVAEVKGEVGGARWLRGCRRLAGQRINGGDGGGGSGSKLGFGAI
jgi:hypothetical protein